MPKIIILVRHGETHDNVNKIFQGWKDSELTQKGLNQAIKLTQTLKQEKIDAIFSSDQKRAHNTAKPLSKKLNLPIKKSKRIREHNLGSFEGLEWNNLKGHHRELWGKLVEARAANDLDWNEHAGESMNEFYQRIKKFLNHIKRNHNNQIIIIFTHGGTLNRILELLKIKTLQDDFIAFRNTSVTVLEKQDDESYKVTIFNDAGHLEDDL